MRLGYRCMNCYGHCYGTSREEPGKIGINRDIDLAAFMPYGGL